MRGRFLLLALVVLPLFSGCGSDGASGPAGASVAPASSALFLSVATDFRSEDWDKAEELVEEFPDGERAVAFLLGELGIGDVDFRGDIEPALGPETDVVGLDLAGEGEFVGLTQPEDPEKLQDVLRRLDEGLLTRRIEDWTVISNSEAVLDRFERERANGTLAGSTDYQETLAEIESGGLVQLYLNGARLGETIQQEENLPGGALGALFPGDRIPSLALALEPESGGVRLTGAASLAGEEGGIVPENFEAELPEHVPAGVLLYVGTSGLEGPLSALRDFLAQAQPGFDRDLARLEAIINVSLDEDVFPLFAGESALYVRAGFLIPEVTLVTEVDDENQALGTVEQLVTAAVRRGIFEPPRQLDVDGVPVVEMGLTGAPVSLFYAAFDGRLVLTTSQSGITGLREEDDRLGDDSDFREALEQADVPEETNGFAYVNLHDAVPYVLGFAEQGGASVPAEVPANLEPLQRLVVYGAKDGRTLRFAGFLAVD